MQAKVYRYTGGITAPIDIWRSLNLQGDAWWFGWSETEMHLPQRLKGDPPNADWERLSLFNSAAELRFLGRGGKGVILLLTETIEPQGEWSLCGEYLLGEPTLHILLGDPPKQRNRDISLVEDSTHVLVDLAYPVQFIYDNKLRLIAGRVRMRVVMEVYHYYDTESRLRFVRYYNVKLHEFVER